MTIIFGGSFNPVTLAHEEIISLLLNIKGINKLILVPNGNSYPNKKLISFDHRKNMLELVVPKSNDIIISDYESNKDFKGTIDTLKYYSKLYDNVSLAIGADQLENLKNWISYQEIIDNYHLIIIKRSGYKINNIDILKSYQILEYQSDISSSSFKNNIANNGILNDKVFEYIRREHLYE
jgi:nicotinate-nucleotide adenylyltransferase